MIAMNRDTRFLIDTVVAAAKLVRDDFRVIRKGDDGDLVTTTDLEIERFIIERINTHYPQFSVVSEESSPDGMCADNCFVLDPLDGTINFAHGLPLWGIQVAMIRNGKPCVSVIYLPRLGELYYADDTGAYLCENMSHGRLAIAPTKFRKISVSKKSHVESLYLVEGGNKFPALGRLNDVSRHWRYFCCTAVNSAWVACGRLGGTILRKDNVWDWLPGQYLVQQAGGVVLNAEGAHICANTKDMAELLLSQGRLE